MTTLTEFATNFSGYDVPPELVKLLQFQDEHDFEGYANGFGLFVDDKDGLETWSQEEGFLSKLLPFAQANGSGSFYALWSGGTAKTTSEMPVIVFGDEGGVHVVAENVKGLLRLLTVDTEPMIDDDEVSYEKDADDHDPTESADEYRRWVKKEFGISPVKDPEPLVTQAQERFKDAFDTWMAAFVEKKDDGDDDGDDDDDDDSDKAEDSED